MRLFKTKVRFLIFLLILFCIVIGGWGYYKKIRCEKGAHIFLEKTLHSIVKNGSYEALRNRAKIEHIEDATGNFTVTLVDSDSFIFGVNFEYVILFNDNDKYFRARVQFYKGEYILTLLKPTADYQKP